MAGISSCPYCAEIYRRYHQVVEQEPEEKQEVCECCNGNPVNCTAPACQELGVCMICSVGDD